MMLARVADSLYWMGRYAERAEHTCRVADVMLNASLDLSDNASFAARIAMAAMGATMEAEGSEAPFEAARRMAFDREDSGSVVLSLARARENARQVRDQITTEMWEQLNALYLEIIKHEAEVAFEHGASAFLHRTAAGLHLFKGAAEATMSHGEGWRFLSLGVYLERAQLIARLLEVTFGATAQGPSVRDHLVQVALLRMACALEPYLRVYTSDLNARNILEFLLLNKEFPRSIRFVTAQMEEHSRAIARHAEAGEGAGPERLAGRLSSRLEFADPDDLTGEGTREILRTVALECERIHHAVYEAFVAYPIDERLPA